MKPKVLVGCPTFELYDYCLNKYVEAVKDIEYENYDVVLVDNSKGDSYFDKIKKRGVKVLKSPYYDDVEKRIVHARNVLRQYALDNDYDYLLCLDQDVIPYSDIIIQLMSHNKDVVSGLYFSYCISNGIKTLTPMLWKDEGDNSIVYVNENEAFLRPFFEIIACGLGCVLISREVLQFVKFRCEDSPINILFCLDVHNKGYGIYADTSVRCVHMLEDKDFDISNL